MIAFLHLTLRIYAFPNWLLLNSLFVSLNLWCSRFSYSQATSNDTIDYGSHPRLHTRQRNDTGSYSLQLQSEIPLVSSHFRYSPTSPKYRDSPASLIYSPSSPSYSPSSVVGVHSLVWPYEKPSIKQLRGKLQWPVHFPTDFRLYDKVVIMLEVFQKVQVLLDFSKAAFEFHFIFRLRILKHKKHSYIRKFQKHR